MVKIFIKTPFIKLSQFLKFARIVENGSSSKTFLLENDVYINGILEKRRNKKLYENSIILVDKKKYLIVKGEKNQNE